MNSRVVIENPYLVMALVGLFGYLIYRGRIAASLGGFYASSNWIFNADLGPVALLRVFLVVLVCTACVSASRKGDRLGRAFLGPQITSSALLVAFWTLYIALRAILAVDQLPRDMLLGFSVYTLLPTVLLLVFVNELADIRELAFGFIVCSAGTAIGSVLIVPAILLGQLGLVLGLGGGEYLSFSWGLSIAVIFGVGAFFAVKRNSIKAIFLTLLGICATVLTMTAARQSMLALAAALGYTFWVVAWKQGKARAILAVLIVLFASAGIMYFCTDLGQGLLSQKWGKSDDDAAIRQRYWAAGWNVFLEHPSAGAGLRYMPDETDSAHNLLIDILASQGMAGLLFLAAFVSLTLTTLRKKFVQVMGPEARLWRTILISILIFTAVHSFASGSMIAEPEFFWAPFLLMQLMAIAEREKGPTEISASEPGLNPPIGASACG